MGRTGETRFGLTKITRRLTWEQDGRLIPSEEHLTQRELFLRRLVLRLSSLTLLSVSVSEFSSSRTERRSQLSSPMTVVSTSSKKTTRFWSLDSVVRVMPSEIFPELDSKSAKLLMCP